MLSQPSNLVNISANILANKYPGSSCAWGERRHSRARGAQTAVGLRQPIRPIIAIDADQMPIERGVMNF